MGQIHNELRRAGAILTGVKALVGMDSSDDGIERLSESIVVVLDPWRRPEFGRVRGEMLAGGGFDQTSAAGEVSATILFNPVGSRALGVVRLLTYQALGIADNVDYKIVRGAQPAGFNANNTTILDTRDARVVAAGTGSILQVLQDSEVAGTTGGATFDTRFVNTTDADWRDEFPYVLGPGTGLMITVRTAAVNRLRGSWRWIERPALPGELG